MSSSKKDKKFSQKGGKVEGPVRHFRLVLLDNKEIHRSEKGIGAAEATISMKANPSDAAKKLMSSICKYQGLKKMDRLKCNSIFWMKETTRGSKGKVYGPYKGKFVNLMKNGKEKIVKLKNGTVIKYSLKPVVKKYKEKINNSLKKKVNKIMKGGSRYLVIYVVKELPNGSFENEFIGTGKEITSIEHLNGNETKLDRYVIYDIITGIYTTKDMNIEEISQYFNKYFSKYNKIYKLIYDEDNINNFNSIFHIFFYKSKYIECKAINVTDLNINSNYVLITKYHGLIGGMYTGKSYEYFSEGGGGGYVTFHNFDDRKVPENEIIDAVNNKNLYLVE